jgi:hypothetical protein
MINNNFSIKNISNNNNNNNNIEINTNFYNNSLESNNFINNSNNRCFNNNDNIKPHSLNSTQKISNDVIINLKVNKNIEKLKKEINNNNFAKVEKEILKIYEKIKNNKIIFDNLNIYEKEIINKGFEINKIISIFKTFDKTIDTIKKDKKLNNNFEEKSQKINQLLQIMSTLKNNYIVMNNQKLEDKRIKRVFELKVFLNKK